MSSRLKEIEAVAEMKQMTNKMMEMETQVGEGVREEGGAKGVGWRRDGRGGRVNLQLRGRERKGGRREGEREIDWEGGGNLHFARR